MSMSFIRFVSRLLVVCMIGLPFQAHAGLIGSDEVVSAAQAAAARDTVASFLSRTEVASQLQVLGLTPSAAKDRVAALTDAEVAKLAGQIESLPAGADSSGGAVILILLIIWFVWWLATKK